MPASDPRRPLGPERERQSGTLERLLTTRVGKADLVAGAVVLGVVVLGAATRRRRTP